MTLSISYNSHPATLGAAHHRTLSVYWGGRGKRSGHAANGTPYEFQQLLRPLRYVLRKYRGTKRREQVANLFRGFETWKQIRASRQLMGPSKALKTTSLFPPRTGLAGEAHFQARNL